MLTDSTKTTFIENITDTSYTLNKELSAGDYYWKVTAFDGDYFTDGFNTKNKFTVKKGTPLPTNISNDLILKKEHSPYLASKKTSIKAGATLTINAGVDGLTIWVCKRADGEVVPIPTLVCAVAPFTPLIAPNTIAFDAPT